MDSAAKLLNAMGALLGAILWPTFFAALVYNYRKEVRVFLNRLPALLDRIRKVKGLGVEAELDTLAANAPASGEITHEQQSVASRFAVQAHDIGSNELLRELDTLCLQYDAIRKDMQPSFARTQAMTRVIVKMRAVGPAISQVLDIYKGSGSAGSRLAAVAMMQMEPAKADIAWLTARFSREAPFIFYHAALALTNAAEISTSNQIAVMAAAQTALDVLRSFDGEPDQETINVLSSLLTNKYSEE